MIFVWLASWKPGLSREQTDEAFGRRAGWTPPDGLNMLGEYWPANSSPAVVSIFEADSFEALMTVNLQWGDVFDIVCSPACTPEEGLQWGATFMQQRDAA
jgi:hypothetical protein